ncbi:MAG: nucleoside phosphorylase [Bacteroidales bacterium]|nr:nucleoside phosphorylase [Bacteroidales bacterium]MCF8333417.1 nucleoside phosphorylase [Bacteroidales bacterium]
MIAESELILNSDGSIYHLGLTPEMIADTIILVGDPGRVGTISSFFDKVDYQKHNREIITHTGTYAGKKLSVMSTGMGTDNLDIVINELDALVNIDFNTRQEKAEKQSLNLVRLGTSGAMQQEIAVDTFVASEYGLGLDGLMNFYNAPAINEEELERELIRQTQWPERLAYPNIIKASPELLKLFEEGFSHGITATAPGFYGPQGRVLRMPLAYPDLNERLQRFEFQGKKVVNFEMETSALYGLGRSLGHKTLTICAVIANRIRGEYSHRHQDTVNRLIRILLPKLAQF